MRFLKRNLSGEQIARHIEDLSEETLYVRPELKEGAEKFIVRLNRNLVRIMDPVQLQQYGHYHSQCVLKLAEKHMERWVYDL